MSRSGVAGDLVPRDITEILAQQNRCSKGARTAKNRSSGTALALGRALGWFRPAPSRQRSSSLGPSRAPHQKRPTEGGTAAARPGRGHEPFKAGPSKEDDGGLAVHYTASQHYQENVFIQASRPKHLQELHTQAQEGLKIQQLEEHKNGVDHQTDQTSVPDGPWPERDASPVPRPPLDSSPVGNMASSSSSTSTPSSFSSRPPLTRQGSTFKPLNPAVRRPEKSKRRNRRTTIMGIPQQVQKELVMQRSSPSHDQAADDDDDDDDDDDRGNSMDVVIIPTVDGESREPSREGVHVHLLSIEALQASREEQLLRQHLQALYRDDLALAHRCGPRRTSPQQRPKSLAVPGLTSSSSSSSPSFLQEPQGPVMSVSPQATYMSTIIPNAILPAAIDVIQIDRTRSGSLAVSKNSLRSQSTSPGSSRSGGADTLEPPSSSHSCHSQSSDTIVSNSSTSSSKDIVSIPATATVEGLGAKEGVDMNTAHGSNVTRVPLSSFYPEKKDGGRRVTLAKVEDDEDGEGAEDEGDEDEENVRNSQVFSRSLSVTKTKKQPPAPPRRTYSLHQQKMERKAKDMMGIKESGGSTEACEGQNVTWAQEDTMSPTSTGSTAGHSFNSISTVIDDCQSSTASSPLNPGYPNIVGSPEPISPLPQHDSTAGGNFDRTLSPSSGYSSQSGTPTLSPKEICPPATPERKAKPPKPERTGSKSSLTVSNPALGPPSAVADQTAEESPSSTSTKTPPQATTSHPSSSSVDVRDLLNIPPPPRVKAPVPPPPETWAHNRRTFELLCGPPPNMSKLLHLQQGQSTSHHQTTKSQTPPEEQAAAQDPKTAPRAVDEDDDDAPHMEESKVQETQVPESTIKENKCESQAVGNVDMVAMLVKESVTQDGHQRRESCQEADESLISRNRPTEDKGPVTPKRAPPPVMKKSIRIKPGQKPEQLQQSIVLQGLGHRDNVRPSPETPLSSPTKNTDSTSEAKVVNSTGNMETSGPEAACGEKTQQPSVPEVLCKTPKISSNGLNSSSKQLKHSGSSPPPSPPPAHLPPPPPSKTFPTDPDSAPPPTEEKEEEEEVLYMESVWPPPPPPLLDLPDLADTYEGQDEMDFPPPPPPFSQQTLLELEQTHPTQHSQSEPTTTVAVTTAQEVALHQCQAPAAENTVEPVSIDPQLELKSDKNPVATTLSPPEVNQHPQEVVSKADLVVAEGQPVDHLTESCEPTELLDLSTAPSKDLQALADQSALRDQETPAALEEPLSAPQQLTPTPFSTTTETPPESHGPSPIDQASVPHIPTQDTGAAAPPVARVGTETVPGTPPCSDNQTPPAGPAPVAACPLVETPATVTFRRQPSLMNREHRNSSSSLMSREHRNSSSSSSSKDLLSRGKSSPTPKEDANIPLVTPSLLQMVRLRTVGADEDQVVTSPSPSPPSSTAPSGDRSPGHQDPSQSSCQAVPQKPVRKSLSMKLSSPAAAATTPKLPLSSSGSPSMRLQEAIRLKTAAMSTRDGLPARLCLRSSMASLSHQHTANETPGDVSQTSPAGGDALKSPSSTASFIFSKSTKKVVIETAFAPEAAAAGLKQSLAAELRYVSTSNQGGSSSSSSSNGTQNTAKPKAAAMATSPSTTKTASQGPKSSDITAAPGANGGVAVSLAPATGQQAQDVQPCSAGNADRTNGIEVS